MTCRVDALGLDHAFGTRGDDTTGVRGRIGIITVKMAVHQTEWVAERQKRGIL